MLRIVLSRLDRLIGCEKCLACWLSLYSSSPSSFHRSFVRRIDLPDRSSNGRTKFDFFVVMTSASFVFKFFLSDKTFVWKHFLHFLRWDDSHCETKVERLQWEKFFTFFNKRQTLSFADVVLLFCVRPSNKLSSLIPESVDQSSSSSSISFSIEKSVDRSTESIEKQRFGRILH